MYARNSGNEQKEYGLSIRCKTRQYESLVLKEYHIDVEYSLSEPICSCENPSGRNNIRLFPPTDSLLKIESSTDTILQINSRDYTKRPNT
jgi:hypothetical protein